METIYNAVTAAKEIKRLLKKKWPKTKFSVRSESYSGGNSINVSWDLGPTTEQVEAIADRFQEGTFDGMTDSYNYERKIVLTEKNEMKILGGAKYVFCNRSETSPEVPNLREMYCKAVCERQGIAYMGDNTIISGDRWERFLEVGSQFYQAFRKVDLYDKEFDGIESDKGGSGACFYSIKTREKKAVGV